MPFSRLSRAAALTAAVTVAGVIAGPAAAQNQGSRKVVIEYQNLAKGQELSTSAFVAHKQGMHLWAVGKPADLPLRMLAEEGNPEWILGEAVAGQGKDFGDAAAAIPAMPGQTRRVELTVTSAFPDVSGVTMIGQTNDGFVGVDAVDAYNLKAPVTIELYPLDAGTVENREDKTYLRAMGGLERKPETAVVGPHPGLRAESQVPADWRFDPKQPMVRVTISPAPTPNG